MKKITLAEYDILNNFDSKESTKKSLKVDTKKVDTKKVDTKKVDTKKVEPLTICLSDVLVKKILVDKKVFLRMLKSKKKNSEIAFESGLNIRTIQRLKQKYLIGVK